MFHNIPPFQLATFYICSFNCWLREWAQSTSVHNHHLVRARTFQLCRLYSSAPAWTASLIGTYRRPAVTHEVPPSPTCLTLHHSSCTFQKPASAYKSYVWVLTQPTYVCFLPTGKLHLLAMLETPGKSSVPHAVCTTNQYLTILEVERGTETHGVLSSRARAKSSLFTLLPYLLIRSPAYSYLCIAWAELYKLTEATASAYIGNTASVHNAPVPG